MINPYFIGVGCGVLYFLAADDPALRHLGMLLFVPAATLLYALVQRYVNARTRAAVEAARRRWWHEVELTAASDEPSPSAPDASPPAAAG